MACHLVSGAPALDIYQLLPVCLGMNNKEIAQVFSDIADFLEMKKDNIFKIRAYRKAARTIGQLPEEIELVVRRGELREIPGVGEAIEKKIMEMLNTGKLGFYEKLKVEFPAEIITLHSIPGIDPKTASILVKDYGINTVDQLAALALSGELSRIPGIDEQTTTTVVRYFLQAQDQDVF